MSRAKSQGLVVEPMVKSDRSVTSLWTERGHWGFWISQTESTIRWDFESGSVSNQAGHAVSCPLEPTVQWRGSGQTLNSGPNLCLWTVVKHLGRVSNKAFYCHQRKGGGRCSFEAPVPGFVNQTRLCFRGERIIRYSNIIRIVQAEY